MNFKPVHRFGLVNGVFKVAAQASYLEYIKIILHQSLYVEKDQSQEDDML
ncbi:hypothetical protein XBKB1_2420004 [Xenorhabdus bovienii str. kraussei Becker Underwood]|uniref:Uncharacterized protein n=1 Tax=Xenorhabdus bovienii str. kraussei Becker Underwood TaxID=1398204 RepID=A0A077PTS5_XENBV|nr:hypothetical protein XBKB1_2420004 [Xenorhabdus bovienii str. kraussei Becker Underwood]